MVSYGRIAINKHFVDSPSNSVQERGEKDWVTVHASAWG